MGTERERNGITRPVVRTGDVNFFLMPTVYIHLLRVITVRLRHRNTSEPTASVSLVAVTTMDVASTYVRITCTCD